MALGSVGGSWIWLRFLSPHPGPLPVGEGETYSVDRAYQCLSAVDNHPTFFAKTADFGIFRQALSDLLLAFRIPNFSEHAQPARQSALQPPERWRYYPRGYL